MAGGLYCIPVRRVCIMSRLGLNQDIDLRIKKLSNFEGFLKQSLFARDKIASLIVSKVEYWLFVHSVELYGQRKKAS